MAILTLLTAKGTVHKTGGLNWGSNAANHTRVLDAYIPIHMNTIRSNPGFFQAKSSVQVVLHCTWDDGTLMDCLYEGNLSDMRTGIVYPKQISSHPHKNTLGIYFRRRLGVVGNRPIVMADLLRYGRTNVEITHTGGNNYYIDFS